MFGEKIVIRILESSTERLDIDQLGYEPEQKQLLLDVIKRPYGMVLVTGPTGSGKTVSLYTFLNRLNQGDINISTAEDPAEIQLPGINQVNVNDKAGLTFAAALGFGDRQALLAQDGIHLGDALGAHLALEDLAFPIFAFPLEDVLRGRLGLGGLAVVLGRGLFGVHIVQAARGGSTVSGRSSDSKGRTEGPDRTGSFAAD